MPKGPGAVQMQVRAGKGEALALHGTGLHDSRSHHVPALRRRGRKRVDRAVDDLSSYRVACSTGALTRSRSLRELAEIGQRVQSRAATGEVLWD